MTDNNKALAVLEVDNQDVQTLAERLLPLWPQDLNPDQALQLAQVSLAYGLDPFLGELIPYQGKPYITVNGMLRKARDTENWQGIIEDRPATPEEYTALKVDRADMLWFISVKHRNWLKANGNYGRVKTREDRSVVAKQYPFELARKRALYRCLREAFGTPLPGVAQDEQVAVSEGDTVVSTLATSGQIQKIHALKAKLGLSEEGYRNGLKNMYGVSSSKELNEFQAEDLLAEWESVLRSRSDLVGDEEEPRQVEVTPMSEPERVTVAAQDPIREHISTLAPAPSAQKHAPAEGQGAKEPAWICEECTKEIEEAVIAGIDYKPGTIAQTTKDKIGRTLCYSCYKKLKPKVKATTGESRGK